MVRCIVGVTFVVGRTLLEEVSGCSFVWDVFEKKYHFATVPQRSLAAEIGAIWQTCVIKLTFCVYAQM